MRCRLCSLCLAAILAAAAAPALADGMSSMPMPSPSDRHAVIEERSKEVMPFDLNRTMHVFRPAADGGLQTIVVHDGDPKQIALVRSHLKKEAASFARGDFSDPAAIHGANMPGLAALREGASKIAVTYASTPNGASIRYKTSDPKLVKAIHEWFAAQVKDHGAHAMMAH